MERNITEVPAGLTRRARLLIRAHGVRLTPVPLNDHRQQWLDAGVPEVQIDRAVAFEERWGGLVLPPSPCYDGGPRLFGADVPEEEPGGGWWFEAGWQRTAVPYSFLIGPNDEFGISGGSWTQLHESIEGWI